MIFQIFKLEHRGMKCLGVKLHRNDVRNNSLRKITSIRWSKTHCCWYGVESAKLLSDLKDAENYGMISSDMAEPNINQEIPHVNLSEEKQQNIEKLKSWMKSKRYSDNTIKVYYSAIIAFLNFFTGKASTEITQEDVICFNNEYLIAKGLSASYQNQIVNAVKLFFKVIENKNIQIELLHRPRREHRLPNVLSQQDVKTILDTHRNMKHKTMLSLIYACGLRRGELLNLIPSDIDSKRGIILIRQSKGKKDRIVPFGSNILELTREYYKQFKPQKWLFEGSKPGEKYGERSLQLILKQAVAKAGIKKPVSLHWLRHSYATHLHERGTDIRYIQELLGHNSSRTTEIYTHVSTRSLQQIRSPFEDL